MPTLNKPFSHLERIKAGHEVAQRKLHHSQQRSEGNPGAGGDHAAELQRSLRDMGDESYEAVFRRMLKDIRDGN